MSVEPLPTVRPASVAWNSGRLVRQNHPFRPRRVRSIRVNLGMAGNPRDLWLLNITVGGKLRGCDVVALRVGAARTEIEPLGIHEDRGAKCGAKFDTHPAGCLISTAKTASYM